VPNSITYENPNIIVFWLLFTIFTIWIWLRKCNIKLAGHNVWVHIFKVCYWDCWILASFASHDCYGFYIYRYLFWVALIYHETYNFWINFFNIGIRHYLYCTCWIQSYFLSLRIKGLRWDYRSFSCIGTGNIYFSCCYLLLMEKYSDWFCYYGLCWRILSSQFENYISSNYYIIYSCPHCSMVG